MTDRELLEAAARAAGIEVMRSRLDDPMQRDMLVRKSARNHHHENGPWNPLTDDGDALRLMARLGLDALYSPEAVEVVAHQHARIEGKETVAPWAWESLLNPADPATATRRAIVRAAAAIAASEQIVNRN